MNNLILDFIKNQKKPEIEYAKLRIYRAYQAYTKIANEVFESYLKDNKITGLDRDIFIRQLEEGEGPDGFFEILSQKLAPVEQKYHLTITFENGPQIEKSIEYFDISVDVLGIPSNTKFTDFPYIITADENITFLVNLIEHIHSLPNSEEKVYKHCCNKCGEVITISYTEQTDFELCKKCDKED